VHRYSRLVEELLELVGIEAYGVAGVVDGGRLLVSAMRDGSVNLYAYDGRGLVRLTREPISGYARPPEGSGRVVFYRDVASGAEAHKLYVVEIDKPGVEEELHPGQRPARLLGVADDGTTIAFAAVHEAGIGVYAFRAGRLWKAADAPGLAMVSSVRGDLVAGVGVFPPETRLFKPFTLDLSRGELKIHEPPVRGNVLALDIAPDGSVVYGLETSREARLYRLDPESGSSEPLGLEGDIRDFKASAFNEIRYTSMGLVVIARRAGRSTVFLEGRSLRAPEGMHSSSEAWNGKLAVTHTSATTPPRIVALDADGQGWETVLEGRKPWWLPEALGGSVYTEVESIDGSRVPTYYLESRRARRPGPTVILVHGGPFSEVADEWRVFASALAAAGFHVVMPNYRGSTGYGLEWMEKIIGDPCGMELEDIVAAARWARESGLASRVYIMGYSYGGYMTLCALTRKPGVFQAGAAGASVADWELMYELSDPAFKAFIEMLFAGRRDLWRERSPITYVENLRDPLVLVHPQNDSRTPLKPVLRFIEEASDRGKRLEAHIAPDMGHVVNKVEDVVKILLPAVLFLVRQEESMDHGEESRA
jgi:dipeptidyl aminopeptidase/acylaminoacyl peptidase